MYGTERRRQRAWRKAIMSLIFATCITLGVSAVAPFSAVADENYAEINQNVTCETVTVLGNTKLSRVKAYPPPVATSSITPDIVRWKPVLYVYEGSQWVKHREASLYAGLAEVLPGGINKNTGWKRIEDSSDNAPNPLLFHQFVNLERGEYAVYHMIHFDRANVDFYGWSQQTCVI